MNAIFTTPPPKEGKTFMFNGNLFQVQKRKKISNKWWISAIKK